MTAALRQFPNFLTAVRLVLAPLTAYLVLQGQDLQALCVFAFAGASDALDGFLARRFALVSRFGEYLDPAADKLLMLACFVTLTMIQQTPLWLTLIVIGRDVAIVLGIALAWTLSLPLKVEALVVGKASTVVQVGYIGLVLLLLTFKVVMPPLATTAAAITAGFALLSGLAYGQLFLKALSPGRRPA
ncbi:MAG TPA: CDP-alcohol phosphatidyltransferase family protein [Rhizomicrobium sp.]|nr:CDP-alcohol phosphatidyltransferase family protein [Rhizomicrobium sp.]